MPVFASIANTIRALARTGGKPRAPKPGDATAPQVPDRAGGNQFGVGWNVGSSGDAQRAFRPPDPGTFEVYRKIAAYPTAAETMAQICRPITANVWNWETREKTTPKEWVDALQKWFDPKRAHVVDAIPTGLKFGFAPYELCWSAQDGLMLPTLKPLRVDFTEFLQDGNQIVGLRNKPPQTKPVDLLFAVAKAFAYTYGGEAGDPYGRSRFENIRADVSRAEQVLERAARYMSKVAGIIGQLHYPDGTSLDASGSPRPNFWIAQQIAADAQAGRWLLIPNKFASMLNGGDVSAAVMEKALAAAGKSDWVVSFLDPGGSDFTGGFITFLEYLDKLIVRGLLQPERAVLEANKGGRADAEQFSDTGIVDSEELDSDFARAFSEGVIDQCLMVNWGEAARGAVFVHAAPLADGTAATAKAIVLGGLGNPVIAPGLAKKIDWDKALGAINIPVMEGQGGALEVAPPAAPKGAPPAADGDAAKAADALKRLSLVLEGEDDSESLPESSEHASHNGNGRLAEAVAE